MVEAVASGVMYSHHPFDVAANDVIISAVWGLGPYAVDGVITPDTYRVGKGPDLPILATEVAAKPVQLVARPDEGLQEIPVPPELQAQPCLSPEQIKTLAGYGIRLEEHYRGPQDVEWLDRAGRLLSRAGPCACKLLRERLARCRRRSLPPLLAGGAVGLGGCGPASRPSDEDLLSFWRRCWWPGILPCPSW
jgi:pyruvate,water dikinase